MENQQVRRHPAGRIFGAMTRSPVSEVAHRDFDQCCRLAPGGSAEDDDDPSAARQIFRPGEFELVFHARLGSGNHGAPTEYSINFQLSPLIRAVSAACHRRQSN